MNTVNAAGYLARRAARAARACARSARARVLLAGDRGDGARAGRRTALVVGDARALRAALCSPASRSAPSFVAGGLLAARLVGAAPARARATAPQRRPRARHLLRRHRPRHRRLGAARAAARRRAAGARLAAGLDRARRARASLATALLALATRGARPAPPAARRHARPRASAGARSRPASPPTSLFGLGYIGYMTFVVTLLREQRRGAGADHRVLRDARPRRRSRRRGSGPGCCSAFAAASRSRILNALLAVGDAAAGR